MIKIWLFIQWGEFMYWRSGQLNGNTGWHIKPKRKPIHAFSNCLFRNQFSKSQILFRSRSLIIGKVILLTCFNLILPSIRLNTKIALSVKVWARFETWLYLNFSLLIQLLLLISSVKSSLVYCFISKLNFSVKVFKFAEVSDASPMNSR